MKTAGERDSFCTLSQEHTSCESLITSNICVGFEKDFLSTWELLVPTHYVSRQVYYTLCLTPHCEAMLPLQGDITPRHSYVTNQSWSLLSVSMFTKTQSIDPH